MSMIQLNMHRGQMFYKSITPTLIAFKEVWLKYGENSLQAAASLQIWTYQRSEVLSISIK